MYLSFKPRFSIKGKRNHNSFYELKVTLQGMKGDSISILIFFMLRLHLFTYLLNLELKTRNTFISEMNNILLVIVIIITAPSGQNGYNHYCLVLREPGSGHWLLYAFVLTVRANPKLAELLAIA